jgi:hypothetical protein
MLRLRDLVVGSGAWRKTVANVRDWRRLAPSHWIVPVWYAMVVERVVLENLPGYLRVDEHEVATVVRLGAAIRQALS